MKNQLLLVISLLVTGSLFCISAQDNRSDRAAEFKFKDYPVKAERQSEWFKGYRATVTRISEKSVQVLVGNLADTATVTLKLFESLPIRIGDDQLEVQYLAFVDKSRKDVIYKVRLIFSDPKGYLSTGGFFYSELLNSYQCFTSNTVKGRCARLYQGLFHHLHQCAEKPFPVKMEAVVGGFLALTAWALSQPKVSQPPDKRNRKYPSSKWQINRERHRYYNNYYKYDCASLAEKLSIMKEDDIHFKRKNNQQVEE